MKRVENLRELLTDPGFFAYKMSTVSRDGGIDYTVTCKITQGGHISPVYIHQANGVQFCKTTFLDRTLEEAQIEILRKLYGKLNDILSDHIEQIPEELFTKLDDFFGGLI